MIEVENEDLINKYEQTLN